MLSRRTPAAELGAEHSTRYGTGRAKMQTTEMISGERHPQAEGVWGKKKKKKAWEPGTAPVVCVVGEGTAATGTESLALHDSLNACYAG